MEDEKKSEEKHECSTDGANIYKGNGTAAHISAALKIHWR